MWMYVWMWCIISVNDILCIVCAVRNSLVCAEELSERKDIGWNMTSCHWGYKQPPPDGVASDTGPNGDRAGVSRCSEGDHAGCIREVPQEEYSPSTYIACSRANCKNESQLIDHILQVLLRKLTSKKSLQPHYRCMHEFTCNSKYPLVCPFPCIMCHVITGVYFSVG